jgi:hypothetical protein
MFESRSRLSALSLALAVVALSGCEASKDGAAMPPPPTETMKALFNPATGAIPHPTDLFFSGSTDGTLNLPTIAYRPASIQNSLNALDGWSTSAPLSTSFTMPLLNTTLTGTTVRLVEMYFSNTTKAPAQGAELPAGVTSPVRRVLVFGTDYTATVSPDVDSGGKTLLITPLKPLTPSTGATNIGYLVILTNGIMEPNGKIAQPDDFYNAIKSAPADCSNFTDATQNAICRLTKAHLAIAGAVGTPAANVVLTWSFTTQSVDDTLGVLAATSTAQPTTVVPTGLTTKQANAALQGKANIFVGRTVVPYYLTPAANTTDRASVLTKFWTAAGPSPVPGLDPTSRHLTRFNPVPAKVADQAIPLLVTVPNATAAGGACAKPASGWPVAIVEHGITRNRSDALAIADAFADACIVLAAIDLPLHGIVDTASPLYCSATNPGCLGARERTFDVDLVNNSNTSVAVSDGRIDASGTHFINLSSPLTSRDNLRQAESDLLTLTKSIATLDLTGDGASDVDPARISFTGLSLGAIAGTAALKFSGGLRTGTVTAPGGVLTRLLLDSQAIGPSIIAGVGAQGLVQNSYLFNLFFRDFQAVADAGDPVNHIAGANARLPLHLQKVVGDSVVPNSATDRLITAGGLRKIATVGPTAVGPGTGGYTTITAGSHGSLFDPTTSLAATAEMQRQAVTFAATAVQPGGPFVVISNPAIIEP